MGSKGLETVLYLEPVFNIKIKAIFKQQPILKENSLFLIKN
jgi:hypothetical protein